MRSLMFAAFAALSMMMAPLLSGCSSDPDESAFYGDDSALVLEDGMNDDIVVEPVVPGEMYKIGDRVVARSHWREHTGASYCESCYAVVSGSPGTTTSIHTDMNGCTTLATWNNCSCEYNPNPPPLLGAYMERCVCNGLVSAQANDAGGPCEGEAAPPPGMPGGQPQMSYE